MCFNLDQFLRVESYQIKFSLSILKPGYNSFDGNNQTKMSIITLIVSNLYQIFIVGS